MPYIWLIDEGEAEGPLAGEYNAAVERAFNDVTRVADGVGIDDEPDWASASRS